MISLQQSQTDLSNKYVESGQLWYSCSVSDFFFSSVDIFIVDLIFFLSQLCFFKSEAVATDSTLAAIESKSGRHAAWGHWTWVSLLVCGVKV